MRFGITFIKGDIDISRQDGKIRYTKGEQKHTYEDWGLIPASRPVVDLPEVKTSYVECDAMDGSGIDVSEALTGYPLYRHRKFSQEFYRQAKDNWPGGFDRIFNWLHGRKIKMILDDDPSHYYTGRVQIASPKSDSYWSTITITAELDPFKYYVYSSIDYPKLDENGKGSTKTYDDTIWDLIDFENGYGAFSNVLFMGDKSLKYTITAGARPVTPYIWVDLPSGSKQDQYVMKITIDEKILEYNTFGRRFTAYGIRVPPYESKEITIRFYLKASDFNFIPMEMYNTSVSFDYRKGSL